MFNYWKRLYWDWQDSTGRFHLVNSVLRLTPGSLGMELRSRYITRFFACAGDNIRIHEGVRFRGLHKIEVGSNVTIGVDNFLQASGGLVLGDNVMLGPGVKIWTINHRFDDVMKPIRTQGFDTEPVFIDEGVWLGANVIVLPGVHLPQGCIVSAGSVVGKKKYPPYTVLAGFPARAVGNRLKKSQVISDQVQPAGQYR